MERKHEKEKSSVVISDYYSIIAQIEIIKNTGRAKQQLIKSRDRSRVRDNDSEYYSLAIDSQDTQIRKK